MTSTWKKKPLSIKTYTLISLSNLFTYDEHKMQKDILCIA